MTYQPHIIHNNFQDKIYSIVYTKALDVLMGRTGKLWQLRMGKIDVRDSD